MLLDPNETANWIPYVIPLGPTTESHIIRYLFPERSLGRVPVDLAFATTMHLPFNESIFPENSGICALLFYNVPVFPNTFRHSTTKQYPCCRNGK